jgi:hypothetical protein
LSLFFFLLMWFHVLPPPAWLGIKGFGCCNLVCIQHFDLLEFSRKFP